VTRVHRGQAMVEMAMILPVLLLIVLGALEFGLAFDHNLTLKYATREGARTGSALANGGGQLGCGGGQSPNAASVDPSIVAAVERVLVSEGSPIALDEISEIRIYKANTSGNESGPVNVWIYAPGQGPIVDGEQLDFKADLTRQTWATCSRNNGGGNPDYIGVSLGYSYHLQTPLGNLLAILDLGMHDQTVMQLNPTNQ
jgi:hypothetical protein